MNRNKSIQYIIDKEREINEEKGDSFRINTNLATLLFDTFGTLLPLDYLAEFAYKICEARLKDYDKDIEEGL